MTADREPVALVDGQVGIDGSTVDLESMKVQPASIGMDPHLAKQYGRADAAAKAKRPHAAPPGSLELPDNFYQRPGVGDCGYDVTHRDWYGDSAAQLLTSYVRIAAGGSRGTYRNGYKSKPGTPKWIAIGIVCPKCGALWLKPGVDLVALRDGSNE